ncbi:hypothetical protein CCM_03092 [Cordyceps militaris CM01]|uniref:Uncharacterized protein n=1 Tax=Cordyceps militaris (strain CM01) TaxID=983644 RepID=G3J8T8_CORMM|nr:uncharacterized protein CCM_03092 [Cordyceps militaris CM01]EGX94821.1 hypothetical protein CCM_03092 [Cordyceps militaris CM01]
MRRFAGQDSKKSFVCPYALVEKRSIICRASSVTEAVANCALLPPLLPDRFCTTSCMEATWMVIGTPSVVVIARVQHKLDANTSNIGDCDWYQRPTNGRPLSFPLPSATNTFPAEPL